MAARSQVKGGIPLEVPDFRDPAVREKYRNDNEQIPHFDPTTYLFPEGHDTAISGKFSETVLKLSHAWRSIGVTVVRRAYDGMSLYSNISDPKSKMTVIEDVKKLISIIDSLAETYRTAREIIAAYPDSKAAEVLLSLLAIGEEEKVLNPEQTKQELTAWLAQN